MRHRLKLLEEGLAGGRPPAFAELRPLVPSAEHWAHELQQTHLIRRLVKLLRSAGDGECVLSLWKTAHEIAPEDVRVLMNLSFALESGGDLSRALAVLEHGLEQKFDVALLGRAATLARKLGDQDRSLALRREAAKYDQKHRALLIGELLATDHTSDALAEARAALSSRPLDPELAFRCYVAFRMLSADAGEAEKAFRLLMASAESASEKHLWAARVHRREGRFDKALAEISIAVDLSPEDVRLRRERTMLALDCGHWGRDAGVILDGLGDGLPTLAELHEKVRQAEGLLAAFGTSLREAAADPKSFAHIRSPESVFVHVSKTTPLPSSRRTGIVMIGWSLAAGGAERILATCFREVRKDPRFGWAKLYLLELSPDRSMDFYLSEAGVDRSEVVLVDRNFPAEPPLSWLPAWRARQAQGIYQQLRRDRPAIVHSWNEPLNVLASCEASTGCPRIDRGD